MPAISHMAKENSEAFLISEKLDSVFPSKTANAPNPPANVNMLTEKLSSGNSSMTTFHKNIREILINMKDQKEVMKEHTQEGQEKSMIIGNKGVTEDTETAEIGENIRIIGKEAEIIENIGKVEETVETDRKINKEIATTLTIK